MNWLEPVTLEGQFVRLEAINLHHASELAVGAADEEIWQFMGFGRLNTHDKLLAWIEDMHREQQRGGGLTFTIVHKASGRAVGSSSLYQAVPSKRRVELGRTWLERAMWRSVVNTESKYLLLRHAFEHLNCQRVEIKTNALNERSQRAIERIGFQFEGQLRNYAVLNDGTLGDTMLYSMLPQEWNDVKAQLEDRLGLR